MGSDGKSYNILWRIIGLECIESDSSEPLKRRKLCFCSISIIQLYVFDIANYQSSTAADIFGGARS